MNQEDAMDISGQTPQRPPRSPLADANSLHTPINQMILEDHCGMEDCCICHSPMIVGAMMTPLPSSKCSGGYYECGECKKQFHRVCMVQMREYNLDACPNCRAKIPEGLTPPLVRAQRQQPEQVENLLYNNAHRESIVSNTQRVRQIMAQRQRQQVLAAQGSPQRGDALTGEAPGATTPNFATAVLGRAIARSDARMFPSPFRSALEVVGSQSADTPEDVAMREREDEDMEAGGPGGPSLPTEPSSPYTPEMDECCHCQRLCEEPGQCSGCGHVFCSHCSNINYDLRDERLFCFDCKPSPLPPTEPDPFFRDAEIPP